MVTSHMGSASSASSSSLAVTLPHSPLGRVSPSSPHPHLNAHHDASALPPSQLSQSQRRLSQIMPAQASLTRRQDACTSQTAPICSSTSGPASSSSTTNHAPLVPSRLHTTPRKSSLRLSHPPPAPSSSFLLQVTPQSKRTRFTSHESSSPNMAASPFAESSSALDKVITSSADTGISSSPSLSRVRPLSGISRPLPLPPTPSRPPHPPHSITSPNSLIPMPQHSVEDFRKLLPHLHPIASLNQCPETPKRTLLQHIPPQPPIPTQTPHFPASPSLDSAVPTIQKLLPRSGWFLTGFRSFDLDLDRIAQLVQLEHQRLHRSHDLDISYEPRIQPTFHSSDHSNLPVFGYSDRGLPSGSILEVLGPPGSGKSSLLLQFAITERLRALRRARESLIEPHDLAQAVRNTDAQDEPHAAGSSFFSDEFWDAEIANADQVLILDCEGAMTPEKLADAAWTASITLWTSLDPTQSADRVDSIYTTLQDQRSAMPEEVRRLVAAVLAGLHVSRVTSLAGLVALLHSLRPTDELQHGSTRKTIPSSLPSRTSLILIDSLSYYLRPSGGGSQDRKVAAQISERVRDMLIRLQMPLEYRPQSDQTIEEQLAARQRCLDAAQKVCSPTIVFTNQLAIRRSRKESDASARSSPAGRASMGAPNRSSNRNHACSEGVSMLAPLLNGTRPPQPARLRDECPAYSVALGGPEMVDDNDQQATLPRHRQPFDSRRTASQPLTHDRGWPPSFLGQDVWRMLLFRHGTFGNRYAQIVSVPPAVQTELSELWTQTRERVTARARTCEQPQASAQTSLQQPAHTQGGDQVQADTSLPTCASHQTEEEHDKHMLKLLSQLRASLFRWRPFTINSFGLIS